MGIWGRIKITGGNMPQFQGSQFAPMFQRKWEIEREQSQPVGRGFAEGLGAGVMGGIRKAEEQQKSNYQLALDMIKEKFKTSQPLRNNEPISFQEEVRLMSNIASGKPIPKDIRWKPRETASDMVIVTPTENNIDYFKRNFQGMNFNIGTPVEMSRKTYERGMQTESSLKKMLNKKQIEQTKYKNRIERDEINFQKKLDYLKENSAAKDIEGKRKERLMNLAVKLYKANPDLTFEQAIDQAGLGLGMNTDTIKILKNDKNWFSSLWSKIKGGAEATKQPIASPVPEGVNLEPTDDEIKQILGIK